MSAPAESGRTLIKQPDPTCGERQGSVDHGNLLRHEKTRAGLLRESLPLCDPPAARHADMEAGSVLDMSVPA
ncbi:hypothetical protein [Bradyrhizobium cosmicum]|uniref:hypothetical protein n=1 Tax=Bradyrhizobium cosmicum TaxID=1404864 RepID=UPI0028E99487|nr:hypothetical protein [Bradyrhizobium cosmicum]